MLPESERPPVEQGSGGSTPRIVALGALCDLGPASGDEGSQSFSVGEFALLDDGRRVMLHSDRGFTLGAPEGKVKDGLTAESLTQDVLNVVLPDDDDSMDDHPWSWLAELARARGLDVPEEHLRELPYDVVLTDRLTRWLGAA